jgi:hypothetical protein
MKPLRGELTYRLLLVVAKKGLRIFRMSGLKYADVHVRRWFYYYLPAVAPSVKSLRGKNLPEKRDDPKPGISA